MKKRWLFLFALCIGLFVAALPELLHTNEGESTAVGSVRNGSLKNGYLLPYSGPNFRYFSPLSYYVLNNAYLHDKAYRAALAAYRTCETTCPGVTFGLMECANADGGRMWVHWTHQNGLSLDFMVPKLRNDQPTRRLDHFGIWHYLLEFTDDGISELDGSVRIDFESIGRHLLALDDAGRTEGLRIKKVILKIELQDELFATAAGQELRKRGIYFVQALPNRVNDLHDDHYHVDFVEG